MNFTMFKGKPWKNSTVVCVYSSKGKQQNKKQVNVECFYFFIVRELKISSGTT